jgi:hypothetical protein
MRTDRWVRAVVVAAVSALAIGPAAAPAQPPELPARVVTVGGHAEISRAAAPAWTPAALRDPVGPGDAVRTQAGRLTLLTASGQALRLGARTQVALLGDGAAPAGGPVRARMDGGRLWLAVRANQAAGSAIELTAGPVRVTARGGGASVTMNPDGSVLVAVSHGAVTCAGTVWERALGQDQQLLVPPAVPPGETARLKRDKRDADWMSWNEEQDKAGGYGAPRAEK